MSGWYLRKQDESVFGPVALKELVSWASHGRIAPEDELSENQKDWIPAHKKSELLMDWMVPMEGGTSYGPLNLFSFCDLLIDGHIHPADLIENKHTGATSTVAESILPELISTRNKTQVEKDTRADTWKRLLNEERAKHAEEYTLLCEELDVSFRHAENLKMEVESTARRIEEYEFEKVEHQKVQGQLEEQNILNEACRSQIKILHHDLESQTALVESLRHGMEVLQQEVGKQTDLAQRHEQETEVLQDDIQRLENENQGAKDRENSFREQVEELGREKNEKDGDLSGKSIALDRVQQELDNRVEEIQKLVAEINDKTLTVEQLQERTEDLDHENKELVCEINEKIATMEQLQAEHETWKNDHEVLVGEIGDQVTTVDHLKQKIQQLEKERQLLSGELKEKEIASKRLEDTLESRERENQELLSEIYEKSSELEKLQTDVSSRDHVHRQLAGEINDKETVLAGMKKDMQSLEYENDQLHSEVEDKNLMLERLNEEIKSREEDKQHLAEEIVERRHKLEQILAELKMNRHPENPETEKGKPWTRKPSEAPEPEEESIGEAVLKPSGVMMATIGKELPGKKDRDRYKISFSRLTGNQKTPKEILVRRRKAGGKSMQNHISRYQIK